MLQLTAMEIRCGIRDRHPATDVTPEGSPIYGIFPVFHIRTVSPIIMTEWDGTQMENGLTAEQKEQAILAHLFQGRTAPIRKRKRSDDTKSKTEIKPKKKKVTIMEPTEEDDEEESEESEGGNTQSIESD